MAGSNLKQFDKRVKMVALVKLFTALTIQVSLMVPSLMV